MHYDTYFLNNNFRRLDFFPNSSMEFSMNLLSSSILFLCTLIIHNPDNRSSPIVALFHVLTRLKVLNDRSILQVVVGRVAPILIASATAG